MIRKLVSIICAAFLLCQLPCMAMAENGDVTIRASYWTEDTLYTFAHFSQDEPETVEAALLVNQGQRGQNENPVSLRDTGSAAEVLLLVDTSSSMSDYQLHLARLAQSLLGCGEKLNVSVGTMENGVQLVQQNITDWDTLQKTLWGLQYRYERSDICGATAGALEYLGQSTFQAGDAVNLVVITDGRPWYSTDAAVEAQEEADAVKAAAAAMDACPEVTVHTVCFGKWNSAAFEALGAGRGLHLQAATTKDGQKAGKTLAGYMDSLYRLAFPLKGYDGVAVIPDTVQLMVENGMYSLGAVRNLKMKPAPAIVLPEETLPQVVLPEEQPTEPDEAAPEETVPEETLPEETVPEETIPEEITEPTEETVEETLPTEPGGENHGIPVALLAVAVVAVLVLVIAVVVLSRRKASGFSVRMRVEVLSGEAVRRKDIYLLRDSLVIGTGKQCDIVLRDPAVASVNTRIYLQDQIVYIEDMGSPMGTVLNGMRLFSSNRLRSEDEIVVGNTVLRVLF